ncbi:TRAP-type C4-dicarboxylate transport system, small permease component [Anaerobranca californiensis DSM 14826]|uniref:TRAP-type C4-dicarboxylate transport system, small permease component n=1 Tax=Anaerobranca californiensis DSM 14826 TaxID=1120989 RepID=A0A1M6K7X6_9FIRM|nr:TRAP transporter small permease [Anaerobranca californiensis]SHJ54967.1 TRAP-type C4-dicarboxylate transport system, small permease component [Anaerobranca californiensis DSM 14826]
MESIFDKILSKIYKLMDILMILSILSLVIIVFSNIIFRYFGKSFTWIDETSRLIFVWMALLAAVNGYKINIHPSFTSFLNKLDKNKRKILLYIINFLILAFLIYLFKGGIDYVNSTKHNKIAILNISVAWKYLAVPVASFVMILETLRKFIYIYKDEFFLDEYEMTEINNN